MRLLLYLIFSGLIQLSVITSVAGSMYFTNSGNVVNDSLKSVNITLKLDSVTNEGIFLSWNEFNACAASGYTIYRADLITGKYTFLSAVNNSNLNFVDNRFHCPQPFRYYIKAMSGCSKTVNSKSNEVVAEPKTNLSALKVKIAKSTAVSDTLILTEWKQPNVLPELILHYNVYRSTNNKAYKLIARVASFGSEFLDYDVNLKEQSYFYKVEPINSCDVNVVNGNVSPKILLKAKLSDGVTKLNWTKHDEWKEGVEKYVIEKMDSDGNWEILKVVDGNTLEAED